MKRSPSRMKTTPRNFAVTKAMSAAVEKLESRLFLSATSLDPAFGSNGKILTDFTRLSGDDDQATAIIYDATLNDYIVVGLTSSKAAPPAGAVAPDAPTNLSATASSGGSVSLTWTASDSPDVTNYDVKRATSADFSTGLTDLGSTPTTSFNDSSAASSTTYYYEVFAIGTGGRSDTSASASVTTNSPIDSPTNFTATAYSSSEIDLSWDAVSGAAGYDLQRSTSSDFTSVTDLGSNGTNTYFYDTGLTSTAMFYYRLFALDSNGNQSSPVFASAETTADATPTNITATSVAMGVNEITWDDSSATVTTFDIYRTDITDGGGEGYLDSVTPVDAEALATENGSSSTYAYDDSSAVSGVQYSYQVEAFDASGTGSSGNSGVVTTADQIAAPAVDPAATISSTQQVAAIAAYHASDGSLDTTFGSGGLITTGLLSGLASDGSTAYGGLLDGTISAAIDGSGNIYLAGTATDPTTGLSDMAVVKLLSNGLVDSANFGTDGRAFAPVPAGADDVVPTSIAIDSTSATGPYIYVGGTADMNDGFTQFAVSRLDLRGNPTITGSNAFGTAGTASFAVDNAADFDLSKILIEKTGTGTRPLLIGSADGTDGNGNTVSEFAMVRLLASGTIDGSFGQNTTTGQPAGLATALFQDSSGTGHAAVAKSAAFDNPASPGYIVIAGVESDGDTGGNSDMALARFTLSGALDTTAFGTQGVLHSDFSGQNDGANDVTVINGTIVAAGYTFTAEGADDVGILTVSSDGKTQTQTTLTDAAYQGNAAFAVTGDASGDLLIAGKVAADPIGFDPVQGISDVPGVNPGDFFLARYTVSGEALTLDTAFGSAGKLTTDFTSLGGNDDQSTAMSILSSGPYAGYFAVVGTSATDPNDSSTETAVVAVYTPTGTLDTAWGDGGRLTSGVIAQANAVYLFPDLSMIVAGADNGTDSNGNPVLEFAAVKLDATGTVEDGSNNEAGPDGTIPTFGTAGVAEQQFSNGDAEATSIAVNSDGSFVLAGDAAGADGTQVFAAAAFNAAGQPQGGFATDAADSTQDGQFTHEFSGDDNATASSILPMPGGGFVISGSVVDSSGISQLGVVEIDANGNLVTSFGGTGSGDVMGFPVLDSNNNEVNVIATTAAIETVGAATDLLVGGYAEGIDQNQTSDFIVGRFALAGTGTAAGIQDKLAFGSGTGNTAGYTTVDFSQGSDQAAAITVGAGGFYIVGSTLKPDGVRLLATAEYSLDGKTLDFDKTYSVLGYQNNTAAAAALTPGGDLIIAGSGGANATNFTISEFDSTGTTVPGFGSNGQTITDFTDLGGDQVIANAVYALPDGRTIVVGTETSGQHSDAVLAMYLADGSLDPSFGIGGLVVSGLLHDALAVLVLPVDSSVPGYDGSILVGGQGPNGEMAVAKFNPDGTPDVGFDGTLPAGSLNGSAAFALAIEPIGSGSSPDHLIVAVGDADEQTGNPGSGYQFSVARFNLSGQLDKPNFNTTGFFQTSFNEPSNPDDTVGATGVIIEPDTTLKNGHTQIVVVGSSEHNSTEDFTMIRLDDTGVQDTSFGNAGTAYGLFTGSATATTAAVDNAASPTRIFVGGNVNSGGVNDADAAIAAFDQNGALVESFGSESGRQINDLGGNHDDSINGLVYTNGNLLASGYSTDQYNRRRMFVGEYDASTGSLLSNESTFPSFYDFYFNGANAMALAPDGTAVVVGYAGPGSDANSSFAVTRVGDVEASVGTPAVITEPANGTAELTFTVTLNRADPTESLTVNYATQDGTALAGTDYINTSGTLTFAPGTTSQTISVPITPDINNQNDTSFSLVLSNPSNGLALATASATGTITNLPTTTVAIPAKGYAFSDSAGNSVKLTVTGGGSAQVVFVTGQPNAAELILSGTTTRSNFNITSRLATTIGDIIINGSIGTLNGAKANVTGSVTILGTARNITLGALTDDNQIKIEGAGVPTRIKLGTASNVSIVSSSAISSLTASSWTAGSDNADVIQTPSLGTLTVAGNFAGGIEAGSLASATIGGSVTGPAWQISGTARSINIRGSLQANLTAASFGTLAIRQTVTDSQIRAGSIITSFRAGSLSGSLVFAGVDSGVSVLPTAVSQFTTSGSIASFTTTIAGGFTGSYVAAATLGSMHIKGAAGSGAGGAAASTFKSFAYNAVGQKAVSFSNFHKSKPIAAIIGSDFELSILN